MPKMPALTKAFEEHTDESFFKYVKSLEKTEQKKRGTKNDDSNTRLEPSAEGSQAQENARDISNT